MSKSHETKKGHSEDMRLINFLGGKNILFILSILLLIGILIYIFNTISFVFKPLQVMFSSIIAPIILAIVFYYILNPIVTFLEHRGTNRTLGTAIVFILFILLVVYGFVLLIPIIATQLTNLVNEYPKYIEQMNAGIDRLTANSSFNNYYIQARDWLDSTVGDIPKMILDWLGNSSDKIMNIFSTISSVVVVLVTFPIILFFMLKDPDKFKPFMMKIIPPAFREDIEKISQKMTKKAGSYIQGQMFVALTLGVLLLTGYLIIGLNYAFVLSLIATFTAVIPFVGATIGVIPAIFVAAFTSPAMLFKMVIVWVVAQLIQTNIVEPNIMGRNLKMHPLMIMIVLLIMGNLLGFIGMILGVPLSAMLKILIEHIFEKFKIRYNRYFGDEDGFYALNEEEEPPLSGSSPVKDFATVQVYPEMTEKEEKPSEE
ncbi:AI-2E family transporter [Trichococcus palustris]|nr:AI-2E family transporter [Trichococcus palustris]